ncbi:hypothetical protein [Candidatus Similichlamydia epinepheli]|uniref:hypothetical protein n=1 Tax=Candidatus Similichlamydia epinepheli TaxID=1903953 RepID=UPI000D3C3598|nr:hypothetical protein [Candidatus Similichlamydia epinepheli]
MIHPTAFGHPFFILCLSTNPAPDGHFSVLALLNRIFRVLESQRRFLNARGSIALSTAGIEVLRMSDFITRMEESEQVMFSTLCPVSYLLTLSEEICFSYIIPNLLNETFPVYSNNIRALLSACELDDQSLIFQILCFQSHLRAMAHVEARVLPPYIQLSFLNECDPLWVPSVNFLPDNLYEDMNPVFSNSFRAVYHQLFEGNNLFDIGNMNHGLVFYNAQIFCFYSTLCNVPDLEDFPIEMAYFCRVMSRRFISIIGRLLNPFVQPGFFYYFIRECFIISGLIIAACSDINSSILQGWSWRTDFNNQQVVFPIVESLLLSIFEHSLNSEDTMCRTFLNIFGIEGRRDISLSGVLDDVIPSQNITPRLHPIFAAVWRPWFRFCRRRISCFLNLREELISSSSTLIRLRTISSLSAGAATSILASNRPLTNLQSVELFESALLSDRGSPCGANCLDWVLLSNLFYRFSNSNAAITLIHQNVSIFCRIGNSRNMEDRVTSFRNFVRYLPFCESDFCQFCSVFFMSRQFLSLFNEFQIGNRVTVDELWECLFCLFARSTIASVLLVPDSINFWRTILSSFESPNSDHARGRYHDPGEGPSTSKRRRLE